MNKKSIKDIDLRGKKVLARVDFNVPQDENGNVTNDARIRGALPTIQYILDQGARLILCSHLGRPKGQFNMKYSVKPAAERLGELLGRKVPVADDVIGESAKSMAAALKDGEVMMIENVRFHAEEEKNDPEFAKEMASLAEIYVNDAFGAAHRAHASTAGVADYLPAVSGFLMAKEIDFIGGVLEEPQRPFVAILGGAKVKDKLGVISNLLEKVDTLIIGGGMAYTFFAAQGYSIGQSIVDETKIDFCKEVLAKAEEKGVKIVLPVDNLASHGFNNDEEPTCFATGCIPEDMQGLDIGPESCKLFAEVIASAKTVMWNGPMGVFEFSKYAGGTLAVANAMANLDGITVIGGGDSAAAVEQLGFASKMTHISTGGGASLEYMEGKVLPGVACLQDK